MPPQPKGSGQGTIPCQREEEEEAGYEAEGDDDDDSFLLLQQSVTLGSSAEVDRLIAQIGEILKLGSWTQITMALPHRVLPWDPAPADRAWAASGPEPGPGEAAAATFSACRARSPALTRAVQCLLWERGLVRGWAAPYCVVELTAGASALCPLPPQPGLEGPPVTGKPSTPQPLSGPYRRGWPQSTAMSRCLQQRPRSQPETSTSNDGPHQLLQQLLLSGNLIKEAVQRLHSR